MVDNDYRDIIAPRQFNFEVVWTEKEECGQVIKEGWGRVFRDQWLFN